LKEKARTFVCLVFLHDINFPHKVPHELLVFLSESETGLKVEKRISRVAVELEKQTVRIVEAQARDPLIFTWSQVLSRFATFPQRVAVVSRFQK